MRRWVGRTLGSVAVLGEIWMTGFGATSVIEQRTPERHLGPAVTLASVAVNRRLPEVLRLHRLSGMFDRPVHVRDVFAFRRAKEPVRAIAAVAALPTAVRPDFAGGASRQLTLIGIAEDEDGAADARRTAIISTSDDVLLVKTGDNVSYRLRVSNVSESAVELQDDLAKNVIVRLTLGGGALAIQ